MNPIAQNLNQKPKISLKLKTFLLMLGINIPLIIGFILGLNILYILAANLLISGIFIFILNLFFSPLDTLNTNLKNLAVGEFNTPLSLTKGSREVSQISESINTLVVNLASAIKKINQDNQIISLEHGKVDIILSKVSDPLILLDHNLKVISFNPPVQKLTGLNLSQVLEKHIDHVLQLYSGETPVTSKEFIQPNTNNPDGELYKQSNLKLMGVFSEPEVELSVSILMLSNTTDIGYLLSLKNKSEKAQLQEMQLDFVSMAAHELRTPLTSVSGYLSVFMQENKLKLTADALGLLNRVDISIKQLIVLVENLLNVSRIERGMFAVNLESVDWQTLIKQAVLDQQTRAKDKNIEMAYIEPSNQIPKSQVDKIRINEVLTNLISNAINYTSSGGKITVSTEFKDNSIITHIQDTGKGIPKEAIPHLFSKFFRVSSKLAQSSKGTGLGLYISKAIVDLHKGKIWVDSEEGKGSTFSFSIPFQASQFDFSNITYSQNQKNLVQ